MLQVTKLMNVTPTELWTKIRGAAIEVMMSDGVVVLSSTEIILSSYAWSILRYINGPIPDTTQHIKTYYNNGVLTPDTYNNIFNTVLWDSVDYLGIQDDPVAIYALVKYVVQTNNLLYNDLVTNTGEHLVGLDILDFTDLVDDVELLRYRAESTALGDTPASVEDAFGKAEQHLSISNAIDKTSNIAWHCRRSLVKTGQALQACFMRGYLFDIDRARIDHPIIANLTEGMDTTEYALLSRESSAAMAAGNGDIQRVSVDGRKMSYVGGNKSRIVPGDCGTKETIKWKVSKSDKNAFVGMWFHTDDNLTPRLYRPQDTLKYVGQYIYRRSPITCGLPNARHTCSKCYGQLAQSVPTGRNIGITIGKVIAEFFVQGTLSTKHHVASQGSSKHVLDVATAEQFSLRENAIYLKKLKVGVVKLELTLPISALHDIQAIFNVDDIYSISMARITHVAEGLITVIKTQIQNKTIFRVNDGKNKSMVSYELADYIRVNPHLMIPRDDTYVIDLTAFDRSKPAFIMTSKLSNFRDRSAKIIATLERSGTIKTNSNYTSAYSVMDTLVWLIESMSAEYGISASAVELLFSAYLSDKESYLLPRGLCNSKHRRLHGIIRNRSLAFWFLFDKSTDAFTTAGPMLVEKRVNGPLDVIVKPQEMLDAYEKPH